MKNQKSKIKNQRLFQSSKILALSFKLGFALCVLIFALFSSLDVAKAQTIDPSTWQTQATGLRTSSNTDQKTAGLTTIITASGIPFVSLQGGVKDRGWSTIIGPTAIDMGEIKPLGTAPSLVSESSDWSHNEMTFSNNLKIWISRLSPATLIQNQNNSLRIFSGNLNGSTIIQGPSWNPNQVTNRTPSPSYPKYMAYSSGGSIQIQAIPASGTTALNLPALDNNWVLVWYGGNSYFTDTKKPITYILPHSEAYQADAPILLKFQNNPTSIIQSPEGGIDLSFSGNSGYTSILPLFGREHLKASDTEGWGSSGSLPADVISKINFWNTNNRLCSYPTQVSETYSYDPNTDTSTISENITYLPVCSGGSPTSGFSILPPMLALTMTTPDQQGNTNPLGIRVNGTLTNADYPTEFGPIQGIDNTNNYSYSVSGLRKYIDNKRIVTNTNSAPAELIQELQNEVQKIIDGGHFKPWMMNDTAPITDYRGDVYFLNSADNLYHLTEIIEGLPDSQQKTDLINYIKTERTNYPPETVYNLPDEGTVRGSFGLDNYNQFQNYGPTDLFLNRVPSYSFYGLARYYDLTGESVASNSAVIASAKTALSNDMREQDWSTLFWFKGFEVKHSAVINSNRHLTGLLGLTKLATSAGDTQTENLSRALLAKAVVQRVAMAKYPRYLYAVNLTALPSSADWMPVYLQREWTGFIFNYNWSQPFDDHRQLAILDQFGVYLYDQSGYMKTPGWYQPDWIFMVSSHLSAFRELVPEAFRLLHDYAGQDSKVYLDKFIVFSPNWYTAYAEGVLGYEHNVSHPIDSFQIFLAKVFIQKDTPQNLEKYLDIPWLDSGDFFYMQKLAETIKAYQGWAWEDEINPPSPTPTPVPCTLTSASWSAQTVTEGVSVNLNVTASGDCADDSVNFNIRRNISGLPDEDAYNQPNPNPVTLTPESTGSANFTASTTWVSDNWFNACALLLTCDPEYFFNATVDSNTQRSADPLLTVTKSTTIPTDPNDWPQVQKDPQHTGYSNETFNINYNLPYSQRFREAWRYDFPPERVHPQVQPIIYQGKVYLGTENGKLYALYAGSGTNGGQVAWNFDTGSPILNSVAANNNLIYVATLDGNMFAIDTNGNQVWKRQIAQKLGFYTAPIIADNKVLIGGRDGNFYALNPSDGNVVWSQSLGSPILHTAAYNNGRVFFGGMNMIVYALNTSNGGIAWQSQKLNGMIFKDFYPVVTQGKVIVRPYAKYVSDGIVPGFPLVQIQGSSSPNYSWLVNNAETLKNGNAASIPEFILAQDTKIADYQAHPENYTKNIFILDEDTGEETSVAPHWTYMNNITGGGAMPCVDKDNYLVMPIGMIGEGGWGRLNLNHPNGPRIVDVLYDGTIQSSGTTWTWPDGTSGHQYPPGFGNRDENLTVTCAQNMIFAVSSSVSGGLTASYSGGYDLTARTWVQFPTNLVPFKMSNSLGGQNPPAISNGFIYRVEDNTVVARTTN